MFAETRKGLGYSLAGVGNRSRRHEKESSAGPSVGRVSRKRRQHPQPTNVGRRQRQGGDPVSRDVPYIAGEWDASVLPMYKHSTQKHRRFMLKKHLLPQFGDRRLRVTRQEIQAYVAHLHQAGYTPKSVDHIHDVLSADLARR